MMGNSPDQEYDDPHRECAAEIQRLRRGFEILKRSNLHGTGPYDARRIIDAALSNGRIPELP